MQESKPLLEILLVTLLPAIVLWLRPFSFVIVLAVITIILMLSAPFRETLSGYI